MKRYAIIENGVVVNIAVSDKPLDVSWKVNPPPEVQIGWRYNGTTYQKPSEE